MMLIFGNAFLKTLQTIHRLAARLVPYFAVSIPIQGRRSRGVPSPPQSWQICLTLFQSGEGQIMPTTLLLTFNVFQPFLRPCKWSKHQKLIRNFTN